LEIAAHIGPATARAQWRPAFRQSVDVAIQEVYSRLNSDIIIPILLESAQSDLIPAKRAAALGFFHNLHTEYKTAGSYLDYVEISQAQTQAATMTGSYTGSLYGVFDKNAHSPPSRQVLRMRTGQKAQKVAELLRYWVEGSTACTVPGAFTDTKADGAIASRAVISSSAVIRPALRHVAEKISSADDAGALRLFIPLMRCIRGVLKRLFTAQAQSGAGGGGGGGVNTMNAGDAQSFDALKSACIKFLEIVVVCFSSRAQPGSSAGRRARQQVTSSEDFALEDLPMGHPIITRQSLEEIGEDAFTVLRGLVTIGGQVKVDSGVISDVMLSLGLDANGQGSSPTAAILGILRPNSLTFLEIESTMQKAAIEANDDDEFPALDRTNIDTDFNLNQKSYALAINAVSMLSTNRPTFFLDSATCLAMRTLDPPVIEQSSLTKAAIMSVKSHLRASCLTLLRNSLSVTMRAADILHKALASDVCGMEIQADKALKMAKQAAALKTAGRAARNRAAIYYEWEGGGDQSNDMNNTNMKVDALSSKRRRAGDDALERMRAAKAARGLGNGIQLPNSMADASELILINLGNLPSSRAAATIGDKKSKSQTSDQKRRRPFTLDYFVDVIMTNGDSLASDENRWYGRDGGDAWVMDISALVSEDEGDDDEEMSGSTSAAHKSSKKRAPAPVTFTLDMKTANAVDATSKSETNEDVQLFKDQCDVAASDAFERILKRSRTVRDKSTADFANQIAARLAWSLNKVKPMNELKEANDGLAKGLIQISEKHEKSDTKNMIEGAKSFAEQYPLVASSIQFDLETKAQNVSSIENDTSTSSSSLIPSLTQRLLNEAYLDVDKAELGDEEAKTGGGRYEKTLELYISSVLQACNGADDKPADMRKKKIASTASSSLTKDLSQFPILTEKSLELASLLCDIDGITKKSDASKRATNQNLATVAATNAAKAAAEKRARTILGALRDAAFQRSKFEVRRNAVNCAVGIAAGRLPASHFVEEKGLQLVCNILYPKASDLADHVVAAATSELERAADYAIKNNDRITEANKEAQSQKSNQHLNPMLPQSDAEKTALDIVRKPANLFIALCIKRPEMIEAFLKTSCRGGAGVLAKAVRINMPKLARATAKKYGAPKMALQVADLASETETPLLLSFMDNLAPGTGSPPSQDLIDACLKIQSGRTIDGEIDPRYIIPVISGMKRSELEARLPEFVAVEDNVFRASLRRMSERLARQTFSFREEPENEPLLGMTLCEQMVYLHRMDFAAASLPQKKYLEAIRFCLEDDEVYTDRVIMAALDHISGTFLNGESLPLAYMRTIILTCSKHETLHSWICHELLPRLIKGRVYNDKRQWEGWMRCAKMLESGDAGVSSLDAIERLPEEYYHIYRSKYPAKKHG